MFKYSFALWLAFSTLLAFSFEVESVPGEYVVKLKDGASLTSLQQFAEVQEVKAIPTRFGQFAKIKMDSQFSEKSVSLLAKSAEIEYMEPNYIYRILGFEEKDYRPLKNLLAGRENSHRPVDPRFGELWGLENTGENDRGNALAGEDINALQAWPLTMGSSAIKIAVIDTGIDYHHNDLHANLWVNEDELNGTPGVDDDGNGVIDDIYGARFIGGVASGDPMDGNGHGTHCAGTIGAVHNEIGVAGVMKDVEMVAVKFLSDSGSGSLDDALSAINYALDLEVDIMSNSWGGGGFSQALFDAISAANEAGIVFVAAAGNSSSNNDVRPMYPATYQVDNVISVAAHHSGGALASFSCFGPNTVHVAAPGQNILSTVQNNGYRSFSGTSMATPHVAGVVGLLLSTEPELSPLEIRDRLIRTSVESDFLASRIVSGGRVDAYRALTNERNVRELPHPDAWQELILDEPFDMTNYAPNMDEVLNVSLPEGAAFVEFHFDEFNTEANYDYFQVLTEDGRVLWTLSGINHGYTSPAIRVEGNIQLRFVSDHSVERSGFIIESIRVNDTIVVD